jgi:hypothetical protein
MCPTLLRLSNSLVIQPLSIVCGARPQTLISEPSRGLETVLDSPETFSTEVPGHTSQAPGRMVRGFWRRIGRRQPLGRVSTPSGSAYCPTPSYKSSGLFPLGYWKNNRFADLQADRHYGLAPIPERSILMPALFGSDATVSIADSAALPSLVGSMSFSDFSEPAVSDRALPSCPGSSAQNTATPSKYPVC